MLRCFDENWHPNPDPDWRGPELFWDSGSGSRMKPIQIRNTDFKSIFCAKNRRDSEPEVCPFRGPFTFSYAKGGSGALCSFPRSYLDSCQDPTKLQLSFQVMEDLFWSNQAPAQLPGKWGSLLWSYLDSCQDPTKLQLSFQVKEDLYCGATWTPARIQPSSSSAFR